MTPASGGLDRDHRTRRAWRVAGGVVVAVINGFIGGVTGVALGLLLQLAVTDDLTRPALPWAPFVLGAGGAVLAAGLSALRTARAVRRGAGPVAGTERE